MRPDIEVIEVRLIKAGWFEPDCIVEQDLKALLAYVRELEAVVTAFGSTEPVNLSDELNYSECYYCHGRIDSRAISPTRQVHSADCPWLKARQLQAPPAGEGGDD